MGSDLKRDHKTFGKNSMNHALDMLRGIQKKPALYFGNRDRPYTSLIVFLSGFSCGYHAGRDGVTGRDWEFVPEEFHRFVAAHFGRPYPDGARGWQTHIREHAKALDLFVQLREDFEKRRTSDDKKI